MSLVAYLPGAFRIRPVQRWELRGRCVVSRRVTSHFQVHQRGVAEVFVLRFETLLVHFKQLAVGLRLLLRRAVPFLKLALLYHRRRVDADGLDHFNLRLASSRPVVHVVVRVLLL